MKKELILARMAKICSAREYCISEIVRKIERLKGDDAIDTQAIISQLCKDKYIDEERYAAAFVRDKSTLAGWGEKKIRYALSAKGLDESTIVAGLEQMEPEKAQKKMETLLGAKYRSLKGEERDKLARLFRFGLGRGYSYNQIKAFYDNIGRG